MTNAEAPVAGKLLDNEARVAYLEDYVEWHWRRGEIWHKTTLLAAGVLGASVALLGKATELPPAFSMWWLKMSWVFFLIQVGVGVLMSSMVPRVAAQLLNSKEALLLGRSRPSPKPLTGLFMTWSRGVELVFYLLFVMGILGLVLAVSGKGMIQVGLKCLS